MKKYFILIFILNSLILFAQVPEIGWAKCYGGTALETANFIGLTNNGGYVFTGRTLSNDGDVSGNNGNYDYWVVNIDNSGEIEWAKCFGGTLDEIAYSVVQTFDNGYIISGSTSSSDGDVINFHGLADYFVVKLDASGNKVWAKAYGGTNGDYGYSIQQTLDSNYIVTGIASSNDGDVSHNIGGWDYWIIKLNSIGDTIWTRSYGGSQMDYARSIALSKDGGYIVGGYTQSDDGDVSKNYGEHDIWIVKLNSSGDTLWTRSYGGSLDDYAYSIKETSDGGYIVVGFTRSNDGCVSGNNGESDYYILKLNSFGDTVWTKCIGGYFEDVAYSVYQTMDSGYIIAGYTSSGLDLPDFHGARDYWIVKLDSIGNVIWKKCLGGSTLDEGSSIAQTLDGGFIVAGLATSDNGDVTGSHGEGDAWIVKLSFETTTVNIDTAICLGDSIYLQGGFRSTPGIYYDTLQNTVGIDSLIIITNLTVNPTYQSTVNTAICEGESIYVGGANRTTSGTYYDTLITQLGCDSIIATNLTVYPIPSPPNTVSKTIKEGESTPSLSATGANVKWYADSLTHIFIQTGSIFQPAETAIGEYAWYVTQRVNGCTSPPGKVTLTIEPANYSPVIPDQIFSINENNYSGQLIDTVKATDEDEDQVIKYFIIEGNTDSIYNLDSLLGFLYSVKIHNYEIDTIDSLIIMVEDNWNEKATDTAIIIIKINNVNEPPIMQPVQRISIYGVIYEGDSIDKVKASDPDNDVLTYSVLDGNIGNVFSLDPQSGGIFSTKDTVLQKFSQYTFNTRAQDNGTGKLSSTSFIIIMVDSSIIDTDPNEPGPFPNNVSDYNKISELIKIYPNPVKDEIYIEFEKSLEGMINIELYSFNGQLVNFTKLNKVIEEQITTILNFSKFESGIYYLRINGNSIQIFKKIIKY